MKTIKHILCLCFISSLIVGCADTQGSAKPKEILMWLVGSERQAQVVQKIGDEFFQEDGIDFRCEAISWSNAHTKYLTCIAADVIPDIGTIGLTWATEFGELGAMVNFAEEFPDDLAKIKTKTFPGQWKAASYKGKTYGIPFDLSLQTMFYRTDIISTPPQTWEELVNLLKQLKKQNRGMIFDWGSISWIGFSSYLWQAGGAYYNAEYTESALDSEQAVKALEFFASLYKELGVPTARVPLEQGMRIGSFPLAISGNWKVDSLRLSAPEISGQWSVALLPSGPTGRRTAFVGGRVMGIFDKSKNKQQAWQFIKFLFDPETQAKLYEAARQAQDSYLPSNTDAWEALSMEEEFKQVLKAQAQDLQGPPAVLGWNESSRFIEEAVQRVILQNADPKQELTKAANQLNKRIKR